MAHNPIFGSDPAKPASSSAERSQEDGVVSETARPTGEWDLGELAAKLAEHGGGRVSPEISADLALQIVLNEIVEQACLATGASGAAIVLERGGEWVCRARAGSNAPQLGARLDAASGLSGACMKTRTVQRCDDAENDPRADAEACRLLGVRSVIILPLLQNNELAGVFEAFSTLPSAFGERDERTLQALSQRVLKNLRQASEPVSAAAEPSEGAQTVAQDVVAVFTAAPAATSEAASGNHDVLDRPQQPSAPWTAFGRGANLMTWALGAVVLAYAVLLTVLVAQRLGGRKSTARVRPPAALSATLAGAASRPAGAVQTGDSPSGSRSAGSSPAPRSGTVSTVPAAGASRATDTSVPTGGLLVYENGKEVFRMKPTRERGEATEAAGANPGDASSAHGTGVQRASAVEPADVLEVPAEVAEGSLLHRVEPDYPEEARQQRIQGALVLEVHIAQDGSVREVTVVSGPPLLAQAATDAVKQWRFKPRLVSGRPAEMQTRITLNFRLPQ